MTEEQHLLEAASHIAKAIKSLDQHRKYQQTIESKKIQNKYVQKMKTIHAQLYQIYNEFYE